MTSRSRSTAVIANRDARCAMRVHVVPCWTRSLLRLPSPSSFLNQTSETLQKSAKLLAAGRSTHPSVLRIASSHLNGRNGTASDVQANMDVLVVDIGGSNVKVFATGQSQAVRFPSSRGLTPHRFITQLKKMTSKWHYDAVSIGYPGEVAHNMPVAEPGNLGEGWVGYDFHKAFGCPIQVVNDAVMQALGVYDGGRMLFLGLGTGIGSALIVERVILPLELGLLPYRKTTIFERLGREGLARDGKKAWLRALDEVTRTLRGALRADYVVLGGGNARKVRPLPPDTRRGDNDDAFVGGFRLWEERVEPHDGPPIGTWHVLT
jgi:predicted NBD/HSP70 family sugar kinase